MKFLFSVFTILVLLIAGLFIAPSFIDWSAYKADIKQQVEKATGYQVDFGGDIDAAFMPYPHVSIEDVSIDSGDTKGPVQFKGRVDKVSASLSFMPLLSGKIVINEVNLMKPVFDVAEQKATTQDQEHLDKLMSEDGVEGQSSSKSGTQNVKLDRILIEDANLTYKPLKGEKMVVSLPKMQVGAQSLKGPFDVDGRVIYKNFDVNVKGTLSEMTSDKPLSLSMVIDGGAYSLSYKGIVDTAKDDPEFQGEVSVNASSLKGLASQFGAKNITIKDQSFALGGLIAGNAKTVQLDNGELRLGQAKKPMPIKFNYNVKNGSGLTKIQNIPGGGMIDIDFATGQTAAVKGQVMVENIKTVVVDVLGLMEAQPFDNPQVPNSVSGDVNVSFDDGVSLKSQSLMVGNYQLEKSDVRYKGGDQPYVKASIGSFEGAKISAEGTLNGNDGVKLFVSHPNAARFIKIFQKDYKSSKNLEKPFSFAGLITKNANVVTVKNMKASMGDVKTVGSLSLNNASTIPSIKADLTFDELDTRALTTGKKSSATQASPVGKSTGKKSSGSPWTRDAIDTSFLRSINLDLVAKAKSLVHGTWRITNPVIDIDLSGGTLDINEIKGGLYGGLVEMSGQMKAVSEGQPLSISSSIKAKDVNLGSLVQAATAQSKAKVEGKGNIDLNLTTSGLSSSALVYGLSGDGSVTSGDLILKGIDLAKITEAISDESLSDLAAVVEGAFKTGETPFQPINHKITIREGTIPVNNFTLVPPTANIISNGMVSFSNWTMDVKNTIDFTNPDDLPNIDMTIKGPLNAPQQNVASDLLTSFIKNKYGAKIQKKINEKVNDLIGDKLGDDNPAGALINNILGLPSDQKKAQDHKKQPAANDNAVEASPQNTEQKAQPKLEEQLIKGLFDRLAK